MLLTELW